MKFAGCSLNGELWEDDKNIYLKPYINTDLEHHAWAGEETDSHREVGETQFLSIRSDIKRMEDSP